MRKLVERVRELEERERELEEGVGLGEVRKRE